MSEHRPVVEPSQVELTQGVGPERVVERGRNHRDETQRADLETSPRFDSLRSLNDPRPADLEMSPPRVDPRPAEDPRGAWLDGVNPVTKVLLALILAVPLMASIDVTSAGLAILLQLLCIPLTGLTVATVAKRLAPVLLFAPIAGVSMLLYGQASGAVYWTFGAATISDGSIELAIAISLRVVALALPTILLFARTDPTELADALAQVAHLPSRFVLGVLAGTRTLGLFLDDWRSMGLARRARGVGDRGALRRFFSMAFVLLVFAVRRGTKLATAMEARGFGSGIERTWARRSTVGPRDAVAVVGGIAIIVIALTVAVAAGTFRFVWS